MFVGSSNWVKKAAGPLAALAVALVNVAALQMGWGRVNTIVTDGLFALVLMLTMYAAGWRAGLAVVAIATAYMGWIFSPPGHLGAIGAHDLPEMAGVPVIYLGVVVVLRYLLMQQARSERLQVQNELLERRQEDLQARHLATQARMEALIALASDVVFLADREGRYLLMNEAGAMFMGLPVDAFIGKTYEELFPPEVARAFRESDRQAIEANGPVHLEVEMVDAEGRRRVYQSTKFPFIDSDGRVAGVAGIARDITDRIRAERAIAEQNAWLQDLDRMKNDFVSAVSHDLRTPLTAIKGYVEFLEDGIGGELSPTQHGFVSHLRAGTERLERLVDDLLDFARLETGQFKLSTHEAEVGELLRRVVGLLQPIAAERRLTLAIGELDDDLRVPLDPARIEQVLINLVGNALKFTPEGGRVAVRAVAEDGGARIEVQDTGKGIPEACQARLFERFYQVDASVPRAKGGIGLGLTIAKALVEAHHGTIGVTSAPDAGSTFWFTLPGGPLRTAAEAIVPTSARSVAQPDEETGARA